MSRAALVALPLLALLASAGRSTGAQREGREADALPVHGRPVPVRAEPGAEDAETVALSGRIETIVLDGAAGRRGSVARRLRTDDGRTLTLDLPDGGAPPDGGERVLVSGVRVGGTIAVASIRAAARSAIVNGSSCATLGRQDVAVLLVTLPGTPAPALSVADVYDAFFGATGSLDAYLREVSYGKAWAAGDVFGWYTLDASYGCDQYEALRAAAIAAADRRVDFRRYSRIFIVVSGANGCTWSGIGTVGCAALASQRDGSFSASTSWVLAPAFAGGAAAVPLLAHEMGHNLGLGHAATRRFAGEALGPLGVQGSIDEYGDPFSSMSADSAGHYAEPHKLALGWATAGANAATVETSGTYTLQPYETAPSGLQILKVRRGTGNDAWITVAYRQPVGSDARLRGQPFGGAIVHYEDAFTGGQSQLLDFTPETATFDDPTLASRVSWSDPYSNLTLAVGDASANGLDVTVSYGVPKCVPGAPSLTMAPSDQSVAAGSAATYTVTVSSNDSSACKSAVFALSASAPAGLAVSFLPSSLTLAPGASSTAAMTVAASPATVSAAYPLSVTASAGLPGSAAASCTVTPAQPILSAVLVTPSIPFGRGDTVPISVTALLGGAPATGATTQLILTKPNGTSVSAALAANADGKAVWGYKVGARDPKGTYVVHATVTSSGQQVKPAPASFVVQ